MRACVHLELPDGDTVVLAPGDLLGRNPRAALPIDDAAVSEAHAMVSLRDGALTLLGLRGGFVLAPDAPPVTEVALASGQTIWLSRRTALRVVAVVLPDSVLAIEGPAVPRQALSGVTSIVVTGEGVEVVGRATRRAAATLWSLGDRWQVETDGETRPVGPGDRLVVGGHALRLVALPLAGAGRARTVRDGGVRAPLRIVARFDTVHIQRDGAPVVVLGHTGARILSELVAFDGPAPWEVVAREVWTDGAHTQKLRARWDMAVIRLRRKLSAAGVRSDLVSADGSGTVELLLYPGDTVDDRT